MNKLKLSTIAATVSSLLLLSGCAMKFRSNIYCDRPRELTASHVEVLGDGYGGLMIYWRDGRIVRAPADACYVEYGR